MWPFILIKKKTIKNDHFPLMHLSLNQIKPNMITVNHERNKS